MTDQAPQDRQRFAELAPFYVNGTLDATDRQWMEDYLSRHPGTQHEIEFLNELQSASRAMTSKVSEPERLKRLLAEWQASRPAPSLMSRVLRAMKQPLRIPAAVFATVAILFVAQSALLVHQTNQLDSEQAYRGDRPECLISGPRLRVVFNPDAKHMEVVLLLRKLEMNIQQGPSETGEFWLTAPAGRSLDEALAMLRTSPLVEESMMVRESRPIPGCAK